jgi:hypothetical protein
VLGFFVFYRSARKIVKYRRLSLMILIVTYCFTSVFECHRLATDLPQSCHRGATDLPIALIRLHIGYLSLQGTFIKAFLYHYGVEE